MMPAGNYYIGDLCYVMRDVWEEACDLMFPPTNPYGPPVDGEFTLKDGRRFAVYSTKYGDGVYPTNTGNNLSVDAGIIGCIKVEDIRDPEATPVAIISLGMTYEFQTDFVTDGDRRGTGTIQFGRVIVETGDYSEE